MMRSEIFDIIILMTPLFPGDNDAGGRINPVLQGKAQTCLGLILILNGSFLFTSYRA